MGHLKLDRQALDLVQSLDNTGLSDGPFIESIELLDSKSRGLIENGHS